MMMRVTVSGWTAMVSFQPVSPGSGGADVVEFSVVEEIIDIEGAAVEQLKTDQVQMDGVQILRGVDQFPNLDGIEPRRLGYLVMPVLAVEQHQHDAGLGVHIFVERQPASLYRRALGDALDDAEASRNSK